MSAEEPQAGQKKGGLDSLSHQELVAKCKNLLNIAQKAKKAKDDALEELANQENKFKEELKSVKDKAATDSSQSIQMKNNLLDLQLEYESSQKKMASLEEEHKVCNAKIKKLEHQLSIEYDKRKNAELLNNNLNEDLNKLTESSGQMRLICKRVMEEKEEIEKDFKEIFQQKIEWTRYLQTAHPNESITSVKDWIAILDGKSSSKGSDSFEEENRILKDTNEEMKRKVEKLERIIEDLIMKKNEVSNEIVSLKNDKVKMVEELNEVRVSRDALLKKMDEVRVETTQLIENSEKLSEENGALRMEKDRFENSFNSLSVEHLKSINEIAGLRAYSEQVEGELEIMRMKLKEKENVRGEEEKEMEEMRIKLKKMKEMKFAEEENNKKKFVEMESMRLKFEKMGGLEIKLKEMENKKLEDEKEMKMKFEEMENMRMKFKENESELNSLKRDHDLLKTEKIFIDNRVIELQKCVKSLEEKIVALNKTVEETTKEGSEKLALSIENADIKKQLETMLEKNAELAEKIKLQDETVIALEDKCSKYESDLDKLNVDIESKVRIIEGLQGQCDGLQEKCDRFENDTNILKQALNEQNLNKDGFVNDLQILRKSEALLGQQVEELRGVENMLKQKLVEQNQEKVKIVNDLNAECEKLMKDVERLQQEKENQIFEQQNILDAFKSTELDLIEKSSLLEKQVEEKNLELEAFKSMETDLIEKLNVLEKQLKVKNSELEAFKSIESDLIEKSVERSKAYEKDLNLLQNENEKVNNRLKVVEAEKNEVEKLLKEKELKIKELNSEVEFNVKDFAEKSTKIEKLLEKANRLISDTDRVITEFSEMFLGSIKTESELPEVEVISRYIDERCKASSEVFDVLKLDTLMKNISRVVLKEGAVKSELLERLKVLESDKEVLEKYKNVLENEKEGLEKDKKKFESEKAVLEIDKKVLETEKAALEKAIRDFETDKEVLETVEERLENEKKVLEPGIVGLEIEKQVLESKIDELGSGAEESSQKISCAQKDFKTELKKTLDEYEVTKKSLEECREKLRITLEENKRTEEIIDDLKCETGKLNSLLAVVQQERDNASILLHKCQLEKRDLETQVEKLRLEDEENLHNLQDLNDRYLSMEEKLNFIFSENEELKAKVVELEEIHDNLLKEVENIVGNNVEILPETVVNDFQNKSVKFDSSVLLKYLREIICSLSNSIQEKDSKLVRLGGEVSDVKKQLENVLKCSEELKMLQTVLDKELSGLNAGNIEAVLSKVVEDSRFFDYLCDSYAGIIGADLQEAKKALKLRLEELKDDGWKFVASPCNENAGEGDEKRERVADEVRVKEEEVVHLQDKNKELKAVAVKMKKKINDLNQLLEAERQKVDAERTKLSQLSAVAKNAQMLQQECDRLADELEECRKTMKQLQKVNDNLENEHKDLQQKYNDKENRFTEVEKDMAAIKTQLESALSKETSLVKELEEVKTEKHVEEVIRKECEKELIITQDKMRKVQLDLDQALLESQKHTVLTQEKHDYEQQLSQSHQTQTQLESKLKEASSTLAQLTTQLETERRDKDELVVQLTKLTAESQKTIETTRVQNEALLNRVSRLELDLRSMTTDRKRFEEEATRLDKEFGAYKVRAQSVLRQKEQGGSSAEQEARDKCAQLQEMCDRTKGQLDCTVEELEQVKLKLDSVVAEKEALDKKCENINKILLQRNKEVDRRMMEHRQHKLSTDTLIQCYKTQLEEKERGHQIELESLRLQLSKLSSRVNNSDADPVDEAAVKVDVENANFYQTDHNLASSVPHADNSRHSPPIDIVGEHGKSLPPRPPLIEREDGEGSEGNEISMFPGSLSNRTGLVPLAKLLSSSLGSDEERDVLSLEKYESLQNEMLASNTRVKHLAALLSEAEKDSALMEEQNTVLKEEIRRLQRCIERQSHAHNVEYLKNVVFKFATLGSGDEKSRLVPVLDTILKLSPEEHKQLTAVAKGETEQTSGWSSYLPTWQ